ncbi:MAG: hypothetical protein M1828_006639 [Chrysothrix sp. TS-e1954]|nr:MAG: hypothetical protein M1828_006639 [Chrysothrix sp. TS-e1954]
MASTVNILLHTFPGLGLPSTLCIPLPSDTTTSDAASQILSYLPLSINSNALRLTTTNNKTLTSPATPSTLATLLRQNHDTSTTPISILPLTLTHLTLGGKGGFGSQLRAAGGRMSTKKRRAQGDPNGSSRNLDGRRLRTVGEAKALAEYLAVKPDMDRREKEERRKRWEDVVDASERTKESIKEGKGRRVDGGWVEEKEDVEGRVREEVRCAMARGLVEGRGSSEESVEGSEGSEGSTPGVEGEQEERCTVESSTAGAKTKAQTSRKVYG